MLRGRGSSSPLSGADSSLFAFIIIVVYIAVVSSDFETKWSSQAAYQQHPLLSSLSGNDKYGYGGGAGRFTEGLRGGGGNGDRNRLRETPPQLLGYANENEEEDDDDDDDPDAVNDGGIHTYVYILYVIGRRNP